VFNNANWIPRIASTENVTLGRRSAVVCLIDLGDVVVTIAARAALARSFSAVFFLSALSSRLHHRVLLSSELVGDAFRSSGRRWRAWSAVVPREPVLDQG